MVEQWPPGTIFGTVNFTDYEKDQLTYSLVSSSPSNLVFMFPNGSMYPLVRERVLKVQLEVCRRRVVYSMPVPVVREMRLKSPSLTVCQVDIRYKTTPIITLSVSCSDAGSPTNSVQTTTSTVLVVVTPTNHCPSYSGASVFYAYENSPPGTIFGTVTAYDEDVPDIDRFVRAASCHVTRERCENKIEASWPVYAQVLRIEWEQQHRATCQYRCLRAVDCRGCQHR